MAVRESERLQELVEELLAEDYAWASELLRGAADASCTTGRQQWLDGHEIFEAGFRLAERAAGRPVLKACDDEGETMLFFIGPEEDVLERIRARSAEGAKPGA